MSSIMASGRTLPVSTIYCIHKLKVVANGFEASSLHSSERLLGRYMEQGSLRSAWLQGVRNNTFEGNRMSEPSLLVDEIGSILRVTLNRPAKLNGLNQEIIEGLRDGVLRYAQRDDLRVFLIRSTGRYFSAGAELVSGGTTHPLNEQTAALRQRLRNHMGGGIQPCQETPPAVPTTGAGDTAITADEVATEIRVSPCLLAHSFQLRMPPRRPSNVQATPLSRVAKPCCLRCFARKGQRAQRRQVPIRQTAPVECFNVAMSRGVLACRSDF